MSDNLNEINVLATQISVLVPPGENENMREGAEE
jgi:hypothetical protein